MRSGDRSGRQWKATGPSRPRPSPLRRAGRFRQRLGTIAPVVFRRSTDRQATQAWAEEAAVRRLGELEAATMDALWDHEAPATVRDVLEMLAARRLAYTTVMTVMNNLYDKGMLSRSMLGRAWVYEPALTRAEYTGQIMRDALLSTKDQTSALAHFVEAMTDEESAALRDLLRRRSRKRR